MNRRLPLAALLLAPCLAPGWTGCGPSGPGPYPLDDVLRLDHLQALGTHNSTHVETYELPAWDYTHLPLGEQLELQGVRQFELDLNWLPAEHRFEVYHLTTVDEGTTCRVFTDCLGAQKDWSDRHPGHHPLFTLLELKAEFDPATIGALLDDVEAQLRSVWPEERLLRPDDVTGGVGELREAVETRGWPTLGELRGRAMYVLLEGGEYRAAYTQGDTTTAGRLMFPNCGGDLGPPICAVHNVNDPETGGATIAAAVAAGHLVRTRADADGEEARAGDVTKRDAAFASGAQFVSTDYPAEREDVDYVVRVPGGTPSRCNPVTAPAGCSPQDIEDPARLAR
ncbi:MAG TPA: Ca2+-dependent phosphoinositide-specific phospholipase C [Myxococcota bacterium]|nr:Ca2+-dependent phosphoinositide-specific phospholipase C [Myxococcota bacterium]HRY96063.1 Ca2+-dependent phosphoinositide-specific phospholipase C [Myxococcota bacterium]HSA24252.1 Ca2+-dependent phosphoinositide-specific phospholipase C [Myxococcota bacterium]